MSIELKELQKEVEELKELMLDTIKIMKSSVVPKRAMNKEELAHCFHISEAQVNRLCKCADSPAYKTGAGKTASWMCNPDKFEQYLVKKTKENWKG
ncbi:hypothetical protein [Velocimicrobium porci]|uniref:Helix-turn-helix domain-containing protein n=1 Tax=Velocimicrobium porci TaxID=2606634 RepID=A0A6L5Y121_9FIRM|nr:hypothetical protein [Velocimicrobium porci]MSS64569.1 hypothetical protein [Velocimicrobium porci]